MTAPTGRHRTDSLPYRPDIDGLRALAVIPVLLFHAELGCTGGFVGVDIFFVISGFLISSLILKELAGGTFSLARFWERRIRRILPAFTVVVIATVAAGWFLYLPDDLKSLGESAMSQATLLSNVYFWMQAGYFSAGSDTMPLLHTWSLAVEEQYYLLFPVIMMLLARRGRVTLAATVASIAVASFVLSVVGSYSYPDATFYLLPTRAWELLAGALLALFHDRLPHDRVTGDAAGWLGLALVCFAIFFYDQHTRFPGLSALPPCLGAVLIVLSSTSRLSTVGRILALAPVRFIGLISYSLYLWHWPLLVFSKYPATEGRSVLLRLALLTASVALAVVSWKYVETPFRKRQVFQRRGSLFAAGGASLASLLVLGLWIKSSDGFPARLSPEVRSYLDGKSHFAFRNQITLPQSVAGQFVELGGREATEPITVLIWGDSHAMSVTPVIDELCRQFSRRGIQATHASTAPVLGYASTGPSSLKDDSPAYSKAVFDYIAAQHVKNVVLAAYWSAYPATDEFKSGLLSTVHALAGTGCRVYVLKDVPIPGFNVPRLSAVTAMRGGNLEGLGISRSKHEHANRDLAETFERISQTGATILDPSALFLNTRDLYGVVKDGKVLYCDKHHLSVEGSRLLTPLFQPIFSGE